MLLVDITVQNEMDYEKLEWLTEETIKDWAYDPKLWTETKNPLKVKCCKYMDLIHKSRYQFTHSSEYDRFLADFELAFEEGRFEFQYKIEERSA